MLAEAKVKITSEMTQNQNNSYIQVVGDYLLKHLKETPQDAEKILNPEKSITKSLEAIGKQAMKKKVGSFAMFTPQEGFDIIMKYFGIDPKGGPGKPAAPEMKSRNDFNIKLEDLL